MAFLTDQILATGVTLDDLIHIVITGDTSQNPAGSSYKATIRQVLSNTYGEIGISDSNGVYTYYSDLTSAISSSVAGDTIVFFTDVVETNAITCVLPDGVNINLNGYSYTLDNVGINNTLETGIGQNRIYNGKIIRTNNGGTSTILGVALYADSTDLYLYNVEIINDSLSTALYVSNSTIQGNYSVTANYANIPAVYVDVDSTLINATITNSTLAGYGIQIVGALSLLNSLVTANEYCIFALVGSGDISITSSTLFSINNNTIDIISGGISIFNSSLTCAFGSTININGFGGIRIDNVRLFSINNRCINIADITANSFLSNSSITSFFGGNISVDVSNILKITNNNFYSFSFTGTNGISANVTGLLEITNNHIYTISASFVSIGNNISIDNPGSIGEILITNNYLFNSSPFLNSRCINSPTPGTQIKFALNTFNNSTLNPIGTNVVQITPFTPDLYGNIQTN